MVVASITLQLWQGNSVVLIMFGLSSIALVLFPWYNQLNHKNLLLGWSRQPGLYNFMKTMLYSNYEMTYDNDTYNKQIFRALLCMRIAPCLIGISKHKHILYSLWIASHFRVLPYLSMKLYYHLLLLVSLLMLLSLLFLLNYVIIIIIIL